MSISLDGTLNQISASSGITTPTQPKFLATISAGTQTYTVDNTTKIISWDSVIYNVGNCFNTSTYSFVAPVAGYYIFFWNLYFYNYTPSANGPYDVFLQKNGTYITRTSVGAQPSSGANPETMSAQMMLLLAANDVMKFGVALYGSGTASLYRDTGYAPSTSVWGGYLMN
jgi:hypothetical protein